MAIEQRAPDTRQRLRRKVGLFTEVGIVERDPRRLVPGAAGELDIQAQRGGPDLFQPGRRVLGLDLETFDLDAEPGPALARGPGEAERLAEPDHPRLAVGRFDPQI